MKKGFRILIALAILVLLVLGCTFQVRPNEVALVMRFGAAVRVVEESGLHFKWPLPVDGIVLLDRRVRVLDPDPNEFLTRDKKNVIASSFMAWSIEDPLKFLRTVGGIDGAEARLTDVMRSTVGEVISSHPFTHLVSHETQDASLENLGVKITELAAAKARENFGVKVVAVRIKRLNFPAQNREAVFRRMESERQSIATGIRSEGLEQYEKIKAQTDRERAQLLAEADRKAQELRGGADADAARIYADAYGADPDFYEFLGRLKVLEQTIGERSTWILPRDHELLKAFEGADAKPAKKEEGRQ